jgi:hypothetical protein
VTSPVKLRPSAVKATRLELLEKQGYTCAICGLACTVEQAVLDHSHREGHVRAVLHRGCNSAEGKVINALKRYGVQDHEAFLKGLIEYHRIHSTNQTGLIHPSYFTPEEKALRRKAKVKRARAKAKKLAPKNND